MSDATPATIREKIRASIYATLDASDLNGLVNQWPGSTKTTASPIGNADPSQVDAAINWLIDTQAIEIAASLPPEHPARRDLLVLTGPYTQGQQIDAHIGEPGEVLVSPTGVANGYRPAEWRLREFVRFQQRNYAMISTFSTIEEVFNIDPSSQIWMSGNASATAKVYLIKFDINWTVTDPILSYSPMLIPTLEAYVLARAFAQHGARLEAAGRFSRERDRALAAIIAGGAIGASAGGAP